MKIAIYAETSALEAIALDRDTNYLGSYSFQFVLGEMPRPEGKWFCGEFELKLPSRDTAVMWAQKALQAEAGSMAKYYEERIAKLLAITWEPPHANE